MLSSLSDISNELYPRTLDNPRTLVPRTSPRYVVISGRGMKTLVPGTTISESCT